MTNSSNNKIRTYWYIDEKGILSLISQCTEYFEEERTIEKHKSQDKKSGIKLAIKALAAIFGSASAEANIEQIISSRQQQTVRNSQKIEQHLNKLTNYLINHNQIYVFDSIDTFLEIEENKLPLFCMAEFKFCLDDDYYLEKTDPYVSLSEKAHPTNYLLDLIKKEKFLLFKMDLNGDSSYHQKWNRVVLGASLEKWLSVKIDNEGNADFGRTSHLALLLRESIGSPISLNFLGHVTKMNTSLYIKPYAIWDIG
ncbi:MAG: hypothetical protein V1782_04705 [Pseudomonadota bacterium]